MVLLVYFGGVLILLMYVSCLSHTTPAVITSTPPIWLGVTLITLELLLPSHSCDALPSLVPSSVTFYSSLGGLLSLFLVIYLLVVLISCVKLCKFYQGALRTVSAYYSHSVVRH